MLRSIIAFGSVAALSLSALGQVRADLQVFTWQGHAPEVDDDPQFAPFIHIWQAMPEPPYTCLNTPELCAEDLAAQIAAAHTEPWCNSNGSNIVVRIMDFAHNYDDEVVGDSGCPDPEAPGAGNTRVTRMAFFASHWDDVGDVLVFEDDLAGWSGATRWAHHHPFQTNALTGSPLAVWAYDFGQELAAQHTLLELADDPNKYRFYFDSETAIMDWGAPWTVAMLDHLREYNDGEIWFNWIVPGSPGWEPAADFDDTNPGMTLAEMFADMVTATDGGPDEWPADISGQLNTSQGATHPANARYMIWFIPYVSGPRRPS